MRNKKYFSFSYGDEQEKATLLICSEGKTAPGRPPRARGGRGKGPRTGPSPPGTCAPMGPRPARASPKWELGSHALLFLLCSLTKYCCGYR